MKVRKNIVQFSSNGENKIDLNINKREQLLNIKAKSWSMCMPSSLLCFMKSYQHHCYLLAGNE